MKIFRRKKNCNCEDISSDNTSKNNTKVSNMEIKILGTGCSNCIKLEENTKIALRELSIDEEIDHIKDFAEIASYGVMSTPALVRDGKVLSYGKVLSSDDIKKLLEEV